MPASFAAGDGSHCPSQLKVVHSGQTLSLPIPPQQPEIHTNIIKHERSDRFPQAFYRPEARHVSTRTNFRLCLHACLSRPVITRTISLYTADCIPPTSYSALSHDPPPLSSTPPALHASLRRPWLINGSAPVPACARRSRSSSKRTTPRLSSLAFYSPSPRVLKALLWSSAVTDATGTPRSHS